MTTQKTYTTAGAFRSGLEERLKNASQTDGMDLNRLRRQVSFDRLLARLFRENSVPWVLKGGYALELRFKTARSIIDIDLTMGRVDDAGRCWRSLKRAIGPHLLESNDLKSDCPLPSLQNAKVCPQRDGEGG